MYWARKPDIGNTWYIQSVGNTANFHDWNRLSSTHYILLLLYNLVDYRLCHAHMYIKLYQKIHFILMCLCIYSFIISISLCCGARWGRENLFSLLIFSKFGNYLRVSLNNKPAVPLWEHWQIPITESPLP